MNPAEFEEKITDAVNRLSKSVVTIRSEGAARTSFFETTPTKNAGSGFIIDSNGNIVTNYHVIENASKVEVILNDGRSFSGSVVGGDKPTDVAIVKIEGTNLTVAELGDSEKLKVGQIALAIGNALDLPGAPTVSMGVVSALHRPLPWSNFIFEGLIQTDAAINPGNSGGPLADIEGRIIGINSAIVPFAQGVGFAIPVNTAKWVMEQVLEKGRVTRPALGVLVMDMNPAIATRFNLQSKDGVIITRVIPNSPAHRAGLHELDIIEGIGNYATKNSKDLLIALSKFSINETVAIKFARGNRLQETMLKLVEAQER